MSDYDRIAQAIRYIAHHATHQPELRDIAAHINLSPFHFQRLFSRWTGTTPKRFLQILTVENAKKLLTQNQPLLDVSNNLGLSSTSRLHDHFITLEAITPGEYKSKGRGLTIYFAVHATPFGDAFIATTERGICRLSFLDPVSKQQELDKLRFDWPQATLTENKQQTHQYIESIFTLKQTPDRPLSLLVSGTNFQLSVWKALLRIPPASITTYSHLASQLGRPRSARAVGTAIGANPIAFLIPCHRVIRQDGQLGGY